MNNCVNLPALNHLNKKSTMKNRCKSEFCLRKYLIGVLIAVTISVALAGCRNKKMTPKRATEFTTDRLNLSEEQSQKLAPIAEDLFAERESLQEIKKPSTTKFSHK